ncbi:MAG: ATP-binding protein [Proteobacteria bacterium]|nr:ATP-binding protein [Pseudomonadota bacterium]
MDRRLKKQLKLDLEKKLVMLSGPRQVGKTTLSMSLTKSYEYLNWDRLPDRKKIRAESWDRSKELWIFDEIHKMKNWKQWLKGIVDTERKNRILVTGSAKLETFKKTGDSMAGRYFEQHLMPLDLKELSDEAGTPRERFDRLFRLSGFPEPYFSGSETFYRRWRKTHLDVIIREDLPEVEAVRRVSDLEFLVELLSDRVASPVSFNSLREDLQTDDKTVKRWADWLEKCYALFRVTPFSKQLKYSTRKAPKFYFFDYPRVKDSGARLENLVALSIYKEILTRNDVEGEDYRLHYLRDKFHHEIDFLVCQGSKPIAMIEVKTSDAEPSPNFAVFYPHLKKLNPSLRQLQLVLELDRPFSTPTGIEVLPLLPWLQGLDLTGPRKC